MKVMHKIVLFFLLLSVSFIGVALGAFIFDLCLNLCKIILSLFRPDSANPADIWSGVSFLASVFLVSSEVYGFVLGLLISSLFVFSFIYIDLDQTILNRMVLVRIVKLLSVFVIILPPKLHRVTFATLPIKCLY